MMYKRFTSPIDLASFVSEVLPYSQYMGAINVEHECVRFKWDGRNYRVGLDLDVTSTDSEYRGASPTVVKSILLEEFARRYESVEAEIRLNGIDEYYSTAPQPEKPMTVSFWYNLQYLTITLDDKLSLYVDGEPIISIKNPKEP